MSRTTVKRILQASGILFLLGGGLAIVLAGYFILSHRQPLILPSPTGPYSVGRTAYDWIDGSRMDPLSETANEKRELLVWVWYPATVSQQNQIAPYLPPAWVNARDKDQGIGQFVEADFSAIQTHSFANAALAKARRAYPVIIMQPGMGPVPTDYTILAENLASHGYIVVAINPTYTSNLVVFPDGRVVTRSEKGTIPDSAGAVAADQDANRIEKVWANDAVFVMDKLQSVNADPSSPFYAKLDLARVGLFGHSFGGATAFRVCQLDARCKAAADLDGTLWSDEVDGSLQQPFMFMTEDACGSNCETMHRMYASANNTTYYLSIAGAKHFNFSDLPLRLSPPARMLFKRLGYIGSIRPARGLEIANAYLVVFFDRYLQGIDSSLLQGPSSEYPEVQFSKH